MIRIFLITITLFLLFSCQNNNVPVVEPAHKNIEKIVSEKTIKLGKHHDNKPEDNEAYKTAAVEVLPKYPGGIQKLYVFIKKNYIIPEEINDDESSRGGVFVSFIIEKDGRVSNISILRDIGYGSGKELERVLKLSPNWNPAMKEGNPVRCLYSIPYYIQ